MRRPTFHPATHPILRTHPACIGVFVGGCVARGRGSRFCGDAHAHTDGEFVGWICYRDEQWARHAEIAIHELAHVVTGHGHTDRWRETVLALGGTLDEVPGIQRSYHKPRKLAVRGAR